MWNDDLNALAIKLRGQGCSNGVIAKEISNAGFPVTRSAVIGHLSRLRAKGVDIGDAPAAPTVSLHQGRRIQRPPRPRQRKPAVKPAAPGAEPDTIMRLFRDPEVAPVPISALSVDECHWPVDTTKDGVHLFCGRPVPQGARQPYCWDHLGLNARGSSS